MSSSAIEVRLHTEPQAFQGKNNRLDTVVVKDTANGKVEELHPAAVFVFIGQQPNSNPFKDVVKTDERGFILTGMDFQTSTEGIFAAGDVRAGSTKQLVSAAGEGAAAALAIRLHLYGHTTRSMEKALVEATK
jgi:thioredoxin reductase (NADPH)